MCCKAEDQRHVCTFYFGVEYGVPRKKTLPSFKQLAIRGAILKTISRHEAFRALHSTLLAVSHRWMEVGQPDAEGQQAAAVATT